MNENSIWVWLNASASRSAGGQNSQNFDKETRNLFLIDLSVLVPCSGVSGCVVEELRRRYTLFMHFKYKTARTDRRMSFLILPFIHYSLWIGI